MKPAVVYLDTSDYAQLYRDDCNAELASVRDVLTSYVDAGKIVIGVSFFVLFELLQDCPPAFVEDRLRRARFLRRLCGLNAFPFFDSLFEGASLATDGTWFPRGVFDDFNIAVMERRFFEKIRSTRHASRKTRRALSNRSNLRVILRQSPSLLDLSEEIGREGLPVSEEFVKGKYFRRYIMGEISRDQADRALRSSLTDPELLFQVWYEYSNRKNPLEQMFRQTATKFLEGLEKLIAAKPAFDEARSKYAKLRREYYRIVSTLPEEVRASAKPPGPPPSELRLSFGGTGKSTIDAIVDDNRAQILWAYVRSRLEGTKYQPSDLVDLAHAMYLPICDLWRTDRSFANVLTSDGSVPYADRVVGSLLDLPGRIDAFLGS